MPHHTPFDFLTKEELRNFKHNQAGASDIVDMLLLGLHLHKKHEDCPERYCAPSLFNDTLERLDQPALQLVLHTALLELLDCVDAAEEEESGDHGD